MKQKFVWCLAVVFFIVSPAFGQSAPDRGSDVARILATLPHAEKTPGDEARRANLFEIIRQLNTAGDCCWGALQKTDRQDYIPADIAVWSLTREHFDIITGTGDAVWIAHGPVSNPAWIWIAVPNDTPDPPDPDCPTCPTCPTCPACPSVDLAPIQAQLDALEVKLTADAANLDAHRAEAQKAVSLVKSWKFWATVIGGIIAGWVGGAQ